MTKIMMRNENGTFVINMKDKPFTIEKKNNVFCNNLTEIGIIFEKNPQYINIINIDFICEHMNDAIKQFNDISEIIFTTYPINEKIECGCAIISGSSNKCTYRTFRNVDKTIPLIKVN